MKLKLSQNLRMLNPFSISNNQTKQKENKSSISQTNPFGVSFKGKVIQADVFEKNIKASSEENALSSAFGKMKFMASALVSGMNTLNKKFNSACESVSSFGNKVKEKINIVWNKATQIDIGQEFNNLRESIISKINFEKSPYSVKNLSKRPVEELKSIFIDELKLIEG